MTPREALDWAEARPGSESILFVDPGHEVETLVWMSEISLGARLLLSRRMVVLWNGSTIRVLGRDETFSGGKEAS